MNRYRSYLDDKPKPSKKTSEQIADEIAAYLASGKQVQEVPRGATGIGPVSFSRPIVKGNDR
jgi:hypothetical protein